jgi:rod shape-determining protein MreB and related proteins
MFKNFFNKFAKDLGIDLGTANTLVYLKDKGIIMNEPSIVAINIRNDQIIAIGEEAKKMLGKTPSHISITKPLTAGVISDFEVAEKMIKHFITKVQKESFGLFSRPRVVIGIPLDITEVERKAVEDACRSAGAREVFLIEQPLAAAIGARLPIQEAIGNMVVEIGGGTTEIAIISLSGIVTWKSLKIAGIELDENIINYVRENFNLLLGEKTAEEIKIKIGNVYNEDPNLEHHVRGRDLLTGLPKEITLTSKQVKEAIIKSIKKITEQIKDTLEETPPELVADIYERGLILSGGGALLGGLDKLIHQETKIPVHLAADPLTTVVRGNGIILDDFDNLKEVLTASSVKNNVLN